MKSGVTGLCRQRLSGYTGQIKDGIYMKTAPEIIALLESELAEAYELHDQARGKDAQEALYHIIKASVITHLLEEIK